MKIKKDKWLNAEYLLSIDNIIQSISAGNPKIKKADLSGIVIGMDSPIDILRKNFLHNCELDYVDLSYSKITGSLSESKINNVNFERSDLSQTTFYNSFVSFSNFNNSKFISNLDDAIFESCSFLNTKFGSGRLGYEYGGRRVQFQNCDFSGSVFRGVEFRAVKFIDCIFTNAKFINCELKGIKILGSTVIHTCQFEKMLIPEWASD